VNDVIRDAVTWVRIEVVGRKWVLAIIAALLLLIAWWVRRARHQDGRPALCVGRRNHYRTTLRANRLSNAISRSTG
jgi:hypothetical protein